jgi:hypothetical protein
MNYTSKIISSKTLLTFLYVHVCMELKANYSYKKGKTIPVTGHEDP